MDEDSMGAFDVMQIVQADKKKAACLEKVKMKRAS